MFSQINGLPLHPLAVHAAVVFVPLAAALGLLFVLPTTRVWARAPLVLVSLAAVASVYVARQSGSELQGALGLEGAGAAAGTPVSALIGEHEKRADLLFTLVVAYAAVAVVAFIMSRGNAASYSGVSSIIVSVVLVIGAAAIAFQTYRVGDIGSRAVWNPTGDVDYSNTGTP